MTTKWMDSFSAARLACLLFLLLVISAAGGCSSVTNSGETKDDPVYYEPVASQPDTNAYYGLDDGLMHGAPDTLPEALPAFFPLSPDGYATLEQLEELINTALSLSSEGEILLAQDHLFTLRDQVLLPAPADADSAYICHRNSLKRRAGLLGGILAENEAFLTSSDNPDSLLTTGYGKLTSLAFPDSLVPATGITLPTLTADLLKMENQAVTKWVDYFTGRGRRNFTFWLEQKSVIDSLVIEILEDEDLPAELIYLAMIESGFSSHAVSSVGAAGPWQFMPRTGKGFGLKQSWWIDERMDLVKSTRAAAKYLKRLHEEFGDWALVLAAYNSGENRVSHRMRVHGHDNFWDMRLPVQTTNYVPKFIAAVRVGENASSYGFTIVERPDLAFDTVLINDATDLDLIAKCAGVDPKIIRHLNPSLKRGATPPGEDKYPVYVPVGLGRKTTKALKKIPADRRLTWRQHRVARGETLGQIASNYGTTVGDIAKLNKLKDVHLIRPGDQLLIPMPSDLVERARNRAAAKGHYVPPKGYKRISYKVKSGDTLGGIAQKLGVTLKHLRKVNAMPRSHIIMPGQKLYAYIPK
jgi:membrane-bound lytic murein transglycosylase D